jgi:hypothetical protein
MTEFEIAFPEGRRFDDRLLRSSDDGRDFEGFVYEALSLQVDGDKLRPGFGRGRDGAIDHMVENADERTVVECKFIGRTTGSTPRARWAEVRRHLTDNLPGLAAKDPGERRRSLYGPWLDPQHRIKGYLFAVSYQFAHADERRNLEKTIADDFLSLSSLTPQLSHLADIHVQVRGWDDFHGELRRRFPLRYRWFGDLPYGIASIRDKRFETRSFRRFLFDDTLPFFSREKYLADGAKRQITREDQLVSGLIAEGGDEALIITGAGGVGKTRLGLELCDRLSKLSWLPLRLTESATSASIGALLRAHASTAQIVLFLDYAEKAKDLSAIASEIALINDGNAHRVRTIATCRISALSGVRDSLAALQPRAITLGTPRASDANEIAFAEWVVRQILVFGSIPQPEQIARICHGLPILAAFALFLYKRDAIQFNEQFGDLGGIRDFRDWIRNRLSIAVHIRHSAFDERTALQRLALLCLHLPMTSAEADDLADRSPLDASLLEIMRTDRWIEDEDDRVIATHDVFSDAIVAHHVFDTRAVSTTRFAELLRTTMEQGVLARALLAVDRLASHPDFDAVDATTIVRGLLGRSSAKVIAAHERLLRGRFISDHGKVELLAEYPELRGAASANRDCDITISQLAENISRLRRRDPSSTNFVGWAAEVLAPLLATIITNAQSSNILLRRAFVLLPDTYRSMVLARIALEPTTSQTHYLLVAWLYARLPRNPIEQAVETWLAANAAQSAKTSFVITAWLDAGGQRDLIDHHFLAWIEKFGTTEIARFAYRYWLDAGGRHDLIERHILAWIETFGTTEGAWLIYRSWLTTGGRYHLIRHHVLAWIETFGASENARFMYWSWLDAGGQRDLIDRHVLCWLETFCVTENARIVFRAWLDAGGQRDLIDRQILTWFEAFGATENAQFVYRAWLDTGGQRDLVDNHVLNWIETFGRTENARFVYQSWLNAKGQRELIDRHLLAWIECCGTIEEADFVYRSWLKAGGDFEAIAEPCLAWFHAHATNYQSTFLLKYILKLRTIPERTLHAAIKWCALFANHEDSIWQVCSLLRKHANSAEVVAIVRAFILNLQLLDLSRLSRQRVRNDEDGAVLSGIILGGLGISLGILALDKRDRDDLFAIHSRLLTTSMIYDAALVVDYDIFFPSLIHNVATLFERGVVDVNRDRAPISRFANWMRTWPEYAKLDLKLAISRLRNAAPSDLWDEIPAPQRVVAGATARVVPRQAIDIEDGAETQPRNGVDLFRDFCDKKDAPR